MKKKIKVASTLTGVAALTAATPVLATSCKGDDKTPVVPSIEIDSNLNASCKANETLDSFLTLGTFTIKGGDSASPVNQPLATWTTPNNSGFTNADLSLTNNGNGNYTVKVKQGAINTLTSAATAAVQVSWTPSGQSQIVAQTELSLNIDEPNFQIRIAYNGINCTCGGNVLNIIDPTIEAKDTLSLYPSNEGAKFKLEDDCPTWASIEDDGVTLKIAAKADIDNEGVPLTINNVNGKETLTIFVKAAPKSTLIIGSGKNYEWKETKNTLMVDWNEVGSGNVDLNVYIAPARKNASFGLYAKKSEERIATAIIDGESGNKYTISFAKCDDGEYVIKGEDVETLNITIKIKKIEAGIENGENYQWNEDKGILVAYWTNASDELVLNVSIDPASKSIDFGLYKEDGQTLIKKAELYGFIGNVYTITVSKTDCPDGKYVIKDSINSMYPLDVNIVTQASITIDPQGENDHYTWNADTNKLYLDFATQTGGSQGKDISFNVTTNPARTDITDLSIYSAGGESPIITATNQGSGKYKFTVPEIALTNGVYEIRGFAIDTLTINVEVVSEITNLDAKVWSKNSITSGYSVGVVNNQLIQFKWHSESASNTTYTWKALIAPETPAPGVSIVGNPTGDEAWLQITDSSKIQQNTPIIITATANDSEQTKQAFALNAHAKTDAKTWTRGPRRDGWNSVQTNYDYTILNAEIKPGGVSGSTAILEYYFCTPDNMSGSWIGFYLSNNGGNPEQIGSSSGSTSCNALIFRKDPAFIQRLIVSSNKGAGGSGTKATDINGKVIVAYYNATDSITQFITFSDAA